MTNITTVRTTRNTKTAGYKEGIGYIATVFSTVTNPQALPTSLLVMVSDLFDRPMEKVLMDVSKALVR